VDEPSAKGEWGKGGT
jgi:hypothetical protein